MKASLETKSVDNLVRLTKVNMLRANPEYQRGQVWTDSQKKRLLDSVMRGYQIPLIYLHHIKTEIDGHKREDFEVIDGQQRINSLYGFCEGAFRLFDPIGDEEEARFPSFIKEQPCLWGGKSFDELDEQLKRKLLDTPLAVVMIETDDENEARDLFIRLQAGMPLSAQEKRDAWPGDFTVFVLKAGGKPQIPKYPGHDFFRVLMRAGHRDRGKHRQLAAQMAMLFLTRRAGHEKMCDINSDAIDTFYHQHLDFDLSSPDAKRFAEVLTDLTRLLGDGKRKRLLGHEAIHLVLLMDQLRDDYTRGWTEVFASAFDKFRGELAKDTKDRFRSPPGEFWHRYGQFTRTNSDRGDTIQHRHRFFSEKMQAFLKPQLKDPQRLFGPLERELVYYRDEKRCQVCGATVPWTEADIHHIEEHAQGGATALENGVLVHRACHPKGDEAVRFGEKWRREHGGESGGSTA